MSPNSLNLAESRNKAKNTKNSCSSEKLQIESDSRGLRVQDQKEKSHKELMYDPK
jgi:hypothetical protein